jgi:hypothetical protein
LFADTQNGKAFEPARVEFREFKQEKEHTMTSKSKPLEGGCTCGHVRYQLRSDPLIVHCCHCSRCQRQTGSAFAINALFMADDVELLKGEVNAEMVDSPSGKGQKIARCPICHIAVWSNYFMGGIREEIRFIRVGTLDVPDQLPPDVHIFTSTTQSWVQFPDDAHVEDTFYDYKTTWTAENLVRLKALRDAVKKVT